MKLRGNFFGSTVGIIVGISLLFSGLRGVQEGIYSESLTSGVIVILGALAYRSAKKTRLNIVESSVIRTSIEVAFIMIVVVSLLLRNEVLKFIAEDPIHLLIWLWALIPYFIMAIFGSNFEVVSYSETSQEGHESEVRVLAGIMGWLLPLGFVVIMLPAWMLAELVYSFPENHEFILYINNSGLWSTMLSEEGSLVLPLLSLTAIEFVGELAFFLVGVYLIWLFFKRMVAFPRLLVRCAIGLYAFSLVTMFWLSLFGASAMILFHKYENILVWLTLLTVLIIWYTLKSTRVANTFVN